MILSAEPKPSQGLYSSNICIFSSLRFTARTSSDSNPKSPPLSPTFLSCDVAGKRGRVSLQGDGWQRGELGDGGAHRKACLVAQFSSWGLRLEGFGFTVSGFRVLHDSGLGM